jgi:hypothetical protein
MLRKSFIIFVVFFLVFNIAATYNVPDAKYAQSDFQRNVINADKYIYSDINYKAVILGSSLAYRMQTDYLPGFYNLALSGMSVYDAGAVLLCRKTLPKTVFIEINIIQRQKSESFSQEFESPLFAFFKRIFPALRTENQPVFLIKKGIDRLKASVGPKHVSKTRNRVAARNVYLPDRLFKPLLAIQVNDYSKRDTALANKAIGSLKQLMQKIEARGSKVILFEMPVYPVIQQSPKAVLIRELVAKNFPQHQFIAIPPTSFKTRDGLHLAQKEAVDYTLYFKAQSDKLFK